MQSKFIVGKVNGNRKIVIPFDEIVLRILRNQRYIIKSTVAANEVVGSFRLHGAVSPYRQCGIWKLANIAQVVSVSIRRS